MGPRSSSAHSHTPWKQKAAKCVILMVIGCSLFLDCERCFVILPSNIVQMGRNQYLNTLKYKKIVRKHLLFMVCPKYSSEVTKVMQKESSVRLFKCWAAGQIQCKSALLTGIHHNSELISITSWKYWYKTCCVSLYVAVTYTFLQQHLESSAFKVPLEIIGSNVIRSR